MVTPVNLLSLTDILTHTATCAVCGDCHPAHDIHGIEDDDMAGRISGLLEENPDEAMCPLCRHALVQQARFARCSHCRRRECPGQIVQVDVDRWDCPRC